MKADDHIQAVTEFWENYELLKALIKDSSGPLRERLLRIKKHLDRDVIPALESHSSYLKSVTEKINYKSLMKKS